MQATRQAVELRRQLAETCADAFLPALASSLNNLGIQLNEAGRRGEAVEAVQQAIDLFRQLAETRPDTFRSFLDACLDNLDNLLARRAESRRQPHAVDGPNPSRP